MAHPMTIPIMAGLSIVGAASGLYLGKAAISDINPVYFSEPASSFHADLAPYRSATSADTALLGATGEVPITSCVGCRVYPEEYRPIRDPAVDPAGDAWVAGPVYAQTPAVAYQAEPSPVEIPADPERESVVRYASYQVAAEEVEAAAQQVAEIAAVSEAEAEAAASE